MVVTKLNLLRLACCPPKTKTPLLVNANAVLALAIASELFQPITGRNTQVARCACSIEHLQLAVQRLPKLGGDHRRCFRNRVFPKGLKPLVSKRHLHHQYFCITVILPLPESIATMPFPFSAHFSDIIVHMFVEHEFSFTHQVDAAHTQTQHRLQKAKHVRTPTHGKPPPQPLLQPSRQLKPQSASLSAENENCRLPEGLRKASCIWKAACQNS